MELLDVLRQRRSIRKYLPQEVEWWKIAEVLDAGRYAPSAGNLQNWNFIVIEDLEKKKTIAEFSLKQYWMVESTLLVVCSSMETLTQYYGVRGEMLYSIQNCAACIQNLLLRAQDLRLGSCWVSAFDEDAVKRLLAIPENMRVQAILTLGYADEKAEMPPKYALHDLCSFEEFGLKKDDSVWPLAKHQREEQTKKKLRGFSFKNFLKKKNKSGVEYIKRKRWILSSIIYEAYKENQKQP